MIKLASRPNLFTSPVSTVGAATATPDDEDSDIGVDDLRDDEELDSHEL
jgi:hypothetical protein